MSLQPPDPGLRASIVVPARDEEDRIGRCLRALASQTGVEPGRYEVLLVLDGCTDSTGDRALEAVSGYPELRLGLLEGPGLGAGQARRVGMETACERLLSLDRPRALIASTDADTVVAPDWLERQLWAKAAGARAIGGRIELLDEEGPADEVLAWREHRGRRRHLELLHDGKEADSGSRVEHWQFSGASMSLTAEAYREVGGLEPRAALEDEYLEGALERCDIPIERPLDVRVSTSPRLVGRASRGLAKDLSLASWMARNTYHEPPETQTAEQRVTVSVIVPISDEETVSSLPEIAGVHLELIQVPLHGSDAPFTADFGPVRGRGDALWRGLRLAEGELVVLLPDASAASMDAVLSLISPLLESGDLELVKGYPANTSPSELSRLVGSPLINLHHPELAGLVDPLSGFVAARRSLLCSLPFPVGPGLDASLVLDTAGSHGEWSIAQAALTSLPEPPRTPAEDSFTIISTFLGRTGAGSPSISSSAPLIIPEPERGGFDSRRVRLEERPPADSLRHSETACGPAETLKR